MPFVLIIAGAVLLIAATRNTQAYLFALLQSDFTGPDNFIYWVISILIVGAIGYIPKAKPISDGFLILIILVLFLKTCPKDSGSTCRNGFFDQFQKALDSTGTSLRQTAIDLNNSLPPLGTVPRGQPIPR